GRNLNTRYRVGEADIATTPDIMLDDRSLRTGLRYVQIARKCGDALAVGYKHNVNGLVQHGAPRQIHAGTIAGQSQIQSRSAISVGFASESLLNPIGVAPQCLNQRFDAHTGGQAANIAQFWHMAAV